VIAVLASGSRGETFIPRVPAARITDIAEALIGSRDIDINVTGIRPGEKVHESLISEEEAGRTVDRGDYYAIRPMLTEVDLHPDEPPALDGEYCSDGSVMSLEDAAELLRRNKLMVEDLDTDTSELLR